MAIELVIMAESMKRSHWHRLKSTSRWFFGFERVRLRTISQPKTLGLGAEMPMEQDEAQCNGLRLSGGTGHNHYCHEKKSTKTLCSVYLPQPFSRILCMTSDTSGIHPRTSSKDFCSHILTEETATAFIIAFPPPLPFESLSLSLTIISYFPHNFSFRRPLRLLIPV